MLDFGLTRDPGARHPFDSGGHHRGFALLRFVGAGSGSLDIYPLQILIAAVVAVTGGVAISFFQDKVPGQSGAATNLYVSASRVGLTSGYLLFGAVAANFGHRNAYVACAGLTISALALSWGAGRAERAEKVRASALPLAS